MHRTRSRLLGVTAVLAFIGLAAACAPPTPPPTQSWTFKADTVTINDSQDEIRDPLFGACIAIPNCDDEPYTLNIGFRVKIGVPGSASTQVVNNRTSAPSLSEGTTNYNLTGAQENPVTFNGLQPLNIADAIAGQPLEVFGVYTWASEEDTIGNGLAADAVADVFEDALNDTLAQGSLPSDLGILLDLILDNILGALGLLANNIPTFGLGDDVLGGGLYLGIAARGDLGQLLDQTIAGEDPIQFDIPLLDLPPDIDGGALFTLTGDKSFNQTFSGSGGTHTYNFDFFQN